MSGRRVRIAVVGVGNFGRLHAHVLAGLPDVELVGICDIDPGRRREVAELVGAKQFDTLETLLRETELDAVVLATPEALHVRQALAAIERGVDVFVEKPLALTAKDALSVQSAAQRENRVVMVGTILRFSTPHRLLRSMVAEGRLGAVLHVRSARYISHGWFPASSAHAVFRAAIHDIDQVLWLSGQRVVKIAAVGHTVDGEDLPRSVVGLLILEGGSSATVQAHFVLPPTFPTSTVPPERQGARSHVMEVIGTFGIARLEDPAGVEVWGPTSAQRPDLSVVVGSDGEIVGALREELAHFVTCVALRQPSPVAPLADSVHGTAVAEAMVRAMQIGRIVDIAEVVE